MATKPLRDRLWVRGILLSSALCLLAIGYAQLYDSTDGLSFLNAQSSGLRYESNRIALDNELMNIATYSYIPFEEIAPAGPESSVTGPEQQKKFFSSGKPQTRVRYKLLSEDERKRLGLLKPGP